MLNFVSALASYSSGSESDAFAQAFAASFSVGYYVCLIVFYVIEAIALMKIFEKAGVTSWYAWIPFLNSYEITKIACGNGWLFLLALIPCVGSLIWVIFLAVKLAPAFGQGGGMIALLILLTPIAYMVLGFGSAQYQGPQ